MNTETYGFAELNLLMIRRGKRLKITRYLKICTATGLGIMIVIELCAFGMGKNYVY